MQARETDNGNYNDTLLFWNLAIVTVDIKIA